MNSSLYTSVYDQPVTAKELENRLLSIMDMGTGIKKLMESESPRWADSNINSVMKVVQVCADEMRREAETLLPIIEGGQS